MRIDILPIGTPVYVPGKICKIVIEDNHIMYSVDLGGCLFWMPADVVIPQDELVNAVKVDCKPVNQDDGIIFEDEEYE